MTATLIRPSFTAEGASAVDAGRLITFPLSHFCEKARWALDHAELSYEEFGYPPAVHKAHVVARGSTTVPVLIGPEGTLRESTDIVKFADRACPPERALYPDDVSARVQIDALIERFDKILGPQARLYFYSWALEDPARLQEWASPGLPDRQRRVLRRLLRAIVPVIRQHFHITDRTRAEAEAQIDEELKLVSERLADGQRYLVGDQFSAADLTFAALAGPALHPPGYGGTRLTIPPVPSELAPRIGGWRNTPAGQHGLRIYREHRHAPSDRAAA